MNQSNQTVRHYLSTRNAVYVAVWILFGGLTSALSAQAQVVDLISHNGFDACWSQAITEQTFLDILHDSIDGQSVCIPSISGSAGLVTYSACDAAACPGAEIGCPVMLHSGPFSGNFHTGSFTATGSANNVTVPISYNSIAGAGSCTITFSDIVLTWAPWFQVSDDGNGGKYMAYLSPQSAVHIDSHEATASDTTCNLLLTVAEASTTSKLEDLARAQVIAALSASRTSVCPLSPPP